LLQLQTERLEQRFGFLLAGELTIAFLAWHQLEVRHALAGQQATLNLGTDALAPVLDQVDLLQARGQPRCAVNRATFLRYAFNRCGVNELFRRRGRRAEHRQRHLVAQRRTGGLGLAKPALLLARRQVGIVPVLAVVDAFERRLSPLALLDSGARGFVAPTFQLRDQQVVLAGLLRDAWLADDQARAFEVAEVTVCRQRAQAVARHLWVRLDSAFVARAAR